MSVYPLPNCSSSLVVLLLQQCDLQVAALDQVLREGAAVVAVTTVVSVAIVVCVLIVAVLVGVVPLLLAVQAVVVPLIKGVGGGLGLGVGTIATGATGTHDAEVSRKRTHKMQFALSQLAVGGCRG